MHSIRKYVGTLLASLVVFGTVCSWFVTGSVQAAVSPRDKAPAPQGRVLQAATGCTQLDRKSGGYGTSNPYEDVSYDALDISVSPTTVKAGQQLTFTFSVKPNCTSLLSNASSFDILLYQPSFALGQSGFQRLQNQPSNGTFQILASTNNFSVGSHRVVAALVSLMPRNVIATTNWLTGGVDFTVEAAAQAGGASLSNQFVASGVDPNGIFYEYSFSYQPGASGVNAAFVSVDCGGGTLSLANPIPYGSGGNAKCIYPKPPAGQPKNYTVTFQALDNNKQAIAGATATAAVTVTGNESNSAVDTGQDPSCFGITNALICGLNSIVGGLVSIFTSILKYAVVDIIGPLIEAVLSVRTYSDDFAQVIYAAWEVLRNIGNIFFILAIVAIGIATVFRISGWAVKDLLVKLIVGALLINFSLTIAQAVLGVADTVQTQFLARDTGAIRAIANPLFTTDVFRDAPGLQLGEFSNTVRIVINFCLAFGGFIAFIGVLFLLIVRIVMLWILLLLSPLPYMAMVLPVTRSMSSKWWSQFFKWAFVTPVLAFMLNLTALIAEQNKDAIQKLATLNPNFTSGDVRVVAFSTAANLIPLAFLFMSLKAGSAFGKGAAGFVDKAIDKGLGAAFLPAAAIGGAVGAGATKLATGTGALAAGAIKRPFMSGSYLNTKAKSMYAGGVAKLAPTAQSGKVGGFIRRQAFNVASGGQLSAAKREKRLGDLKYDQELVGAHARDARRLAAGETPYEVQAFKDSQLAKAAKEKREEIKDNTSKYNNETIQEVLGSNASSFAKTAELLERAALALEKNTFDGDGMAGFKNRVAVTGLEQMANKMPTNTQAERDAKQAISDRIAAINAGGNATIEEFYQAGAAAGVDRRYMEQLRDKINAKMLADNKFDNVVQPGDQVPMVGAEEGAPKAFDASALDENWKFRMKRVDKKSASDMATNMHADMFKDPRFAAHFAFKFNAQSDVGQQKTVDLMNIERLNALSSVFKTAESERAFRDELAQQYKPLLVREYASQLMQASPTVSRERIFQMAENRVENDPNYLNGRVDAAVNQLRQKANV